MKISVKSRKMDFVFIDSFVVTVSNNIMLWYLGWIYLDLGWVTRPNLGLAIHFLYLLGLGLSIEEGREGARTKGLQKSNLRYHSQLTTPRNHRHTWYRQWATWRMWVFACSLGSSLNHGVVCRINIIQKNVCTLVLTKSKHTIELTTTLVC